LAKERCGADRLAAAADVLQSAFDVTNAEQDAAVRKHSRKAPRKRVRWNRLEEYRGGDRAGCISHSESAKADALMAVLPADHYIQQTREYQKIVSRRWVLHGTRTDGGAGILQHVRKLGWLHERMRSDIGAHGIPVYRCADSPKTGHRNGERICRLKNYHWNAGMFFWRVSTFLSALQAIFAKRRSRFWNCLPHKSALQVRDATRRIRRTGNISVDTRSWNAPRGARPVPQVFVIPAEVGWSDIVSWAAVYELLRSNREKTVSRPGHAIDASGNFVSSTGKFVAAIGVKDLVVVRNADALADFPPIEQQDVGRLEMAGRAEMMSLL